MLEGVGRGELGVLGEEKFFSKIPELVSFTLNALNKVSTFIK